MIKLIDSISQGVPEALTEIITLGRTLKQRADVLAYFDRPGTSNTQGAPIGIRTPSLLIYHSSHVRGAADRVGQSGAGRFPAASSPTPSQRSFDAAC